MHTEKQNFEFCMLGDLGCMQQANAIVVTLN